MSTGAGTSLKLLIVNRESRLVAFVLDMETVKCDDWLVAMTIFTQLELNLTFMN